MHPQKPILPPPFCNLGMNENDKSLSLGFLPTKVQFFLLNSLKGDSLLQITLFQSSDNQFIRLFAKDKHFCSCTVVRIGFGLVVQLCIQNL